MKSTAFLRVLPHIFNNVHIAIAHKGLFWFFSLTLPKVKLTERGSAKALKIWPRARRVLVLSPRYKLAVVTPSREETACNSESSKQNNEIKKINDFRGSLSCNFVYFHNTHRSRQVTSRGGGGGGLT